MKRFLALLLALTLLILPISFSYAAFTAPVVSRLAAAGAAAAGTAGIRIPARVTGTTSTGSNVAGWISLLVPGGAAAKIACAGLGIAGALAADYIWNKGKAWFDANGVTRDGDDFIKKTNVAIPDGYTSGDFIGDMPDGGVGEGFFTAMMGAKLACEADNQAACLAAVPLCHGVSQGCTKVTYPYPAYPPENPAIAMQYYWTRNGVAYRYLYPLNGVPAHNEDSENPMSLPQVQSALTTSLTSGNYAAQLLAIAGLDVAAAALDNPNHPLNANIDLSAAVAAALSGSVNANQLTNLEAGATPNIGDQVLPDDEPNINALTPAQIAAAVQAALAGQGLSASQIAAAIAAAQSAAAGGASAVEIEAAMSAALAGAGLSAAQIQAAVEAATAAAFPPVGAYTGGQSIGAAAWVAPEVGDFAGLFSSFLEDMKNTPLFSLPGLLSASVPSGGNCEMSVNMSQRFGGTKTISICNWETGLSGVKAALLCVASIFAIGIVTKGGG